MVRYYKEKGEYRNDLLRNPEVLFQTLSYEASLVSALRSLSLARDRARVLDVGCGGGGSLVYFLKLGFHPSNLYGIDILEERILEAKTKFPSINWVCGDAENMKVFEDNTFDIVFESTMFIQITDDDLSQRIANEMLRVANPCGYIILADWRYSMHGDLRYKALSRRRICQLFDVGSQSSIIKVDKGALIPPIGRFLSNRIPFMYFVVSTLFPFLVGQVTTVLQKR